MAEQSSLLGKDFILFANKASRLMDEGKTQQALNLCEAGVRRFPFYASGHYVLGLCYESLDKIDEAKNEFERVLLYEPAHNNALRRLSEIYRKSGLKQVADDFLIREHLYNAFNKQLVADLKEKNIYERLMPGTQEQAEEADQPEQADQEIVAHTETEEIPEKMTEKEEENVEENLQDDLQPESDTKEIAEDEDAVSEKMKHFDPLADNVLLDEEDLLEEPEVKEDAKPANQDLSQYDNVQDDFSTIMDGIFDEQKKDEPETQNLDGDDWIEVENLLIDEDTNMSDELESGKKEKEEKDIDPLPDSQDETELLLEELSHSELLSEEDTPAVDKTIEITADEDDVKEEFTTDEDLALAEDKALEDPPDVSETVDNGQETAEVKTDDFHTEPTSEAADEKNAIPGEEADTEFSPEETATSFKPTNIPEYVPEPVQEETDAVSDDVSIRDMMENPHLVTPTFGEILIAQHKFSEARHVFLELSKKQTDNQRFIKKIEFLDKFLEAQNTA